MIATNNTFSLPLMQSDAGKELINSVETSLVAKSNKTFKYAHYFVSGDNKYVVLTETTRPRNGFRINVSDKTHAKRVAKQYNVARWNY